jgi:hypothetical protein
MDISGNLHYREEFSFGKDGLIPCASFPKRIFPAVIFCLFINNICHAQFPAPHNFSMGYQYISIDDIGYCNGQSMSGATYCWKLQWEIPDLSLTEAQLEGYKENPSHPTSDLMTALVLLLLGKLKVKIFHLSIL